MRHSWTLTTTHSDWAQIIVYFATPLVAKGPLNAEASLRRFVADMDSAERVNPAMEVRGSLIKGKATAPIIASPSGTRPTAFT